MVLVSVPSMLMYSIMSLVEFCEKIQTVISSIVKCLEDSDSNVRWVALNGLSSLATHGTCLCSSNINVLNHVFS